MPLIRGVARRATTFGHPDYYVDDPNPPALIAFTPSFVEDYHPVILDANTALLVLTPTAGGDILASEVVSFRDQFGRTLAPTSSGFGVADIGGTWLSDLTNNFSIDGSKGIVNFSIFSGGSAAAITPSVGTDQIDAYFDFGSDTAILDSVSVAFTPRSNGGIPKSTVSVSFVNNHDGTYTPVLNAYDAIAGSHSNFVSTTSVTPGGLFLSCRVFMDPTNIFAKIWAYGTPEPPDVWQVVTSISGVATDFKQYFVMSGFATNDNFFLDNVYVYSNVFQNTTDQNTGILGLAPTFKDKELSVDANTGLLALAPSVLEVGPYVDTGTALLNLLVSALDEKDDVSSFLATLAYTVAFPESALNLSTFGTGILNLLPLFLPDLFAPVDVFTARVRFSVSYIEFKNLVTDSLIDGTLEPSRYGGSLELARFGVY